MLASFAFVREKTQFLRSDRLDKNLSGHLYTQLHPGSAPPRQFQNPGGTIGMGEVKFLPDG